MAASPLLDRELRDDRPFITGVLNRALSRNVKLPASSISTDSPNVSGRLQKGETRFREERLEGHKESAQPGNEPSGVFSRRIQENFRKIFGTMAHKCASPEDPFAEEVLDECTSSNSKLDGSCNQPSLKTELSDLFERKPSSDFAYEIFACPSNCRGTVLIPTGAILATTGTCATCKSEWILTKQSPLTISLYSWRPKIGFTPGRYVREAIGLEITVGTVSRFLSTEVFLGLQVDDELLRHSEKRATILHDYVVEFLYDYPVHLRPSTFYVLKAGIEKVLFADQPGGSIMVRMIRECLK